MRQLGLSVLVAVALLAGTVSEAAERPRKWVPLAADGIHDPRNPALGLLQQPAEALSKLPPDTAGNQVRWVEALDRGLINPRTNIFPETKFEVLDQDIILSVPGGLPSVRFPHRQHTLWLDCSMCHEQLFVARAGANKMSMLAMLNGEQCGRCHGAVAFPLTECNRCHNVSHTSGPAAARPNAR